MKFDSQSAIVIALVVFLLLVMFGSKMSSGYSVTPSEYAPADLSGSSIPLNPPCAMKGGVGLASSLIPREIATKDDFGQFAPDAIVAGQNFLDPRQQVGWPETIGGALRNANQQIRAEPPNPKSPYTWNNSTIVPDIMQRSLCT
jgi:hypothetical protein